MTNRETRLALADRCQLRCDPACDGRAEVAMVARSFHANTCLPCGKAWQKKFPHIAQDLSIMVLASSLEVVK